MKMPSYLKRLEAKRLGSVVGFVVATLRRRIAMKRLQKMAVDLHMKYFAGDRLKNIGGKFNNHYEFSCSSSPAGAAPSTNTGSGLNNWNGRFLLRTLMPASCNRVNVKDGMESESDYEGIPQFIAREYKDDDQYFSYVDPSHLSANSYSNESSSDSFTAVSTTRCSNCSEIDRQAEEFIASFYHQMRLQRQDSYGECHERFARGSS